ncbi:hypothetical protein [Aquisalimonas sp.]|uniref:hypothetical protein n=1 Tax=Aquisalimonas sp. TaxID=1872621 RepID=UPI0025C5C260|nr:hypothetical protein [Aquisalimonas sp.]
MRAHHRAERLCGLGQEWRLHLGPQAAVLLTLEVVEVARQLVVHRARGDPLQLEDLDGRHARVPGAQDLIDAGVVEDNVAKRLGGGEPALRPQAAHYLVEARPDDALIGVVVDWQLELADWSHHWLLRSWCQVGVTASLSRIVSP